MAHMYTSVEGGGHGTEVGLNQGEDKRGGVPRLPPGSCEGELRELNCTTKHSNMYTCTYLHAYVQ